jgi:hypothetical protein
MATSEFELVEPPTAPRARELWLQHAAGFILFEDVRRYAVERLDPALDATARSAALKAIDDAVYGLMMVIDGVTGALRKHDTSVSLSMSVRLQQGEDILQEMDLLDGDGACMGYHSWREGDFGQHPVARQR